MTRDLVRALAELEDAAAALEGQALELVGRITALRRAVTAIGEGLGDECGAGCGHGRRIDVSTVGKRQWLCAECGALGEGSDHGD